MPMTASEFDYIQRLLLAEASIVLEPGKEYLVESRLTALSEREGLRSIQDLLLRLRAKPFGALRHKVVEAMTTNETLFFRDFFPFETLRKSVLPELLSKRAHERRLAILSAGCSTGQEPYSIAMLLREHFPQLNGWSLQLLASDLSTEVLAKARLGRYKQMEVNRGLPASYLGKYFRRQGPDWEIKEEIRRMVEFFPMNLSGRWPSLPPLDVLFMRNVLIYFDVNTKKKILAQVRMQLKPDGYLFLGGAETTFNIDSFFDRVQCEKGTFYCPSQLHA